jgi:hypothetical protein
MRAFSIIVHTSITDMMGVEGEGLKRPQTEGKY